MGKTFSTGLLTNGIWQDASNNIGIGGSPSGSYKLEVTGTGRFSGALTGAAASFSGNVGVGIASGTTLSGLTLFQVGSNASLTATTSGIGSFYFGNNAFLNTSGSWQRINTGFASDYYQENGKHAWRTIGSGSAGSTFAYNQVMTLDASGNLGIGTSSPTGKLMAYGSSAGNVFTSVVSNQGGSTQVGINFSPSMTDTEFASNPAQASIYATDSNYGANIIFANKTTGAVGNALTERMRITSGGQVLINRTATSGQSAKLQIETSATDGIYVKQNSSGGYTYVSVAANNGGTYYYMVFTAGATDTGSITSNNGVNTTYATSSDYRIKEDFKEIKGLEKISAIKVYDFKFKNTEHRMDGVIAHELQEIIPYAVVGEKDGEKMQGVDYSLLTPILVKAIQEMNTKIIELEKIVATK